MCLDENNGSFVLTKMTGRVSWRKHLHGLSLYSAELGFFFLSRGGLFSAATPIRFFFPCLLFPSQGVSIDRKFSEPGGTCLSHTRNTLIFSDHACLCFLSALGVCNRIFCVFFHFFFLLLSDAIWVDIPTGSDGSLGRLSGRWLS